jgi:hypothetical protein
VVVISHPVHRVLAPTWHRTFEWNALWKRTGYSWHVIDFMLTRRASSNSMGDAVAPEANVADQIAPNWNG